MILPLMIGRGVARIIHTGALALGRAVDRKLLASKEI